MTTTNIDRTATIGGSDVAAILGISPFRTPLDVWREKVLRQADTVDTPATRAGARFEPYVREAYAKLLPEGSRVWQPEPTVQAPYRASPDGIAEVAGWQRLVEIKTTALGSHWGAAGSDEVPMHYAVQALWYLDILGLEDADFPVLSWPYDTRDLLGLTPPEIVAAVELRVFKVRYSPSLAKDVRAKVRQFWEQHVLAETPPPAVDLEDAKRLAWSVTGKCVDLTETEVSALIERDRIKAEIKAREKQVEAIDFVLRTKLGDAEHGMVAGRPVLNCKTVARAGYTVAPTEYRTLTVTKHWKEIAK